ncbi:mannitol dehydrogenase family protein [Streptomyces radicis]|uniref:Mannitol-1-phosphate 5-dehydrogenase n=1 Tax=Streptomyces radicis TaxID=1750517 RepID=A0A3A9WEF8_9ACTN|nr:mannitol dehydrogenase family protein [Streptomyces radicis]RKN04437.1 mannitol dehydrogenase family protein [Streptomyces radicis]RKN15205.1 mannitol dehydrogenase family protein [Streptomyces radicis]
MAGPVDRLTGHVGPPPLGAAGLPARVRRVVDRVPPPGILHVGLGGFHRAHQAVYTAGAVAAEGGDWGIVGAAHRSRDVVDALRRQAGLYTVVTVTGERFEPEVIGVHAATHVEVDEPGATETWLADPAIKVVTLTVTESAYATDSAVVQRLARGLRRRHRSADGAPLSLVSCDNLPGNGRVLRRLVTEVVERSDWAERARLLSWLESDVGFPSSMVDRVVPAPTPALRQRIVERCGYDDAAAVAGEPYSAWVVEDDFPAGRPAWERAGAVLTGDATPYEQVKLRLVNAPHSLIAWLGLLDGVGTIAEAVAREDIEGAARRLMKDDMAPTLTPPPGLDPAAFTEVVLARFANTALGHTTAQVGSLGSVKLAARLTPALGVWRSRGAVPRSAALLTAAYLLATVSPAGEALGDPLGPELRRLWADSPTPERYARAALGESALLPQEIGAWGEFAAAVTELMGALHQHGVPAAIRAAVGA